MIINMLYVAIVKVWIVLPQVLQISYTLTFSYTLRRHEITMSRAKLRLGCTQLKRCCWYFMTQRPAVIMASRHVYSCGNNPEEAFIGTLLLLHFIFQTKNVYWYVVLFLTTPNQWDHHKPQNPPWLLQQIYWVAISYLIYNWHCYWIYVS